MIGNIVMAAAAILLTEVQVLDILRKAGFGERAAHTMVCIGKHESGLNPEATNINKDGSKDHGLFQINDKFWKGRCHIDKLMDPMYNAQCAKIVYEEQGLEAWAAYRSRRRACNMYKVKEMS